MMLILTGHNATFTIFTDNGFWIIGPAYTKKKGYVASSKSGQPLLGIKWQYYTKGKWRYDDDTLTVTGFCLTILPYHLAFSFFSW